MANKKLELVPTLTEGCQLGIKNFVSLLLTVILYGLTVWIPWLNVGTTIGLYRIIIDLTKGKIIKIVQADGTKRYDFQFVNTRGFKTTVEGLSYKFDREFWNYARLISGVLRYGMPIDQVVHMISGLQMDNDSINNWTTGVARVLKRYVPGAEILPEDE